MSSILKAGDSCFMPKPARRKRNGANLATGIDINYYGETHMVNTIAKPSVQDKSLKNKQEKGSWNCYKPMKPYG